MQDPTEHPKGPQRDPKNNESRRYGGPLWAPLAAHKGPQRGPQDTLGAPRGPPKQRQTKTQSPFTKNAKKNKKGQQKHTPNPTAIYEGLVLMPFGGPLLPFRGPFLEMPRHEENTKTIILLQFWTPRGAQTLENPVFYEGS